MATSTDKSDQVQAGIHPFECFSTLLDRHDGPAAFFAEQEEYKTALKLTKFNNSKPLDRKIWRKIRHPSKSSLKSHVRSGVEAQLRRELWLTLLRVKDEDVTMYSKALGQPEEYHTPTTPTPYAHESCLPSFSHGPSFKLATSRLLQSLSLDTVPLLPVLSHLFLHFLEEWESYASLIKLLQRQCWLDRTEIEEKASILTLTKLVSTHLKNVSLSLLRPVGMSEEVFMSQLLSQWCFWPFLNQPFWIAVRVLDMYLLEGPKLLYRLGLAAIKHFVSSTQYEGYKMSDIPLEQYITHYLSTLSLEQRSQWITDSLAIPRMSWDAIFKNWIFNCSLAQGDSSVAASISLSPTSSSSSGGVNSQPSLKKKFSLGSYSEILDQELVEKLTSWFPDWALGDTLECLFKASKHGYNLRTLYHQCEMEETLILVVRTLRESVFGAFIVGSLTDRRNNTFFGSGETFLFTLKPHPQRFEWTAESDLILRGNDEEIIIGSGGGNYGLWLDGDLNRGSTGTCSSYDNPPLTGTGHTDFHCSAIEVYSITTSVQ